MEKYLIAIVLLSFLFDIMMMYIYLFYFLIIFRILNKSNYILIIIKIKIWYINLYYNFFKKQII